MNFINFIFIVIVLYAVLNFMIYLITNFYR